MADEIPENVNGYVFQDGRCVSIEDADTIYQKIVSKVEDPGQIRGILRGLVDECLNAGLMKAALAYLEKEASLTDDPKGLARIHLTTGTVITGRLAQIWLAKSFKTDRKWSPPYTSPELEDRFDLSRP